MIRALCVGECMIEMRYLDASTARISYAGDTYNTAVYLRRTADALGLDVEVGYLTGLGSDEDSAAMRSAWAVEGVSDRSILLEDRLPGLYTVRTDEHGERRFSYWRDSSAARRLFRGADWVSHVDGDLVHVSGITLQLASAAGRGALRERLTTLRSGGVLVSLDTNFRASGWSSPTDAAQAMDAITGVADIVFATLEDEVAMHRCQSADEAAARLADLGVPEVVVKSGADGALVITDGQATHVPATPVDRAVDTTAAGDAFAGGYLAARLREEPPVSAARIGADVAAAVVSHPGAIIPAAVPLTRSRR